MKILAAIDPGSSGGIAWQIEKGEVETCSFENRTRFIEMLRAHRDHSGIIVFMEKVTGYYPKPKMKFGEKEEFNLQASSFSMFNFGKSAGLCLGICEAFGIEPKQVMPAQWQKCCFAKKSGTRQQWKNKLKEIAQRRFPDIKVTLTNADALLILSYGMLVSNGEIDIAPSDKQQMKG